MNRSHTHELEPGTRMTGIHTEHNHQPPNDPQHAADLTPDEAKDLVERLRQNIRQVYIGNTTAIDRLIVCLLARGHVLIEDVPGVGKTVLATALARSLDCTFSRVQLTPDMLPADVLGVSVYDSNTGEFHFKQGPIFANILLADEINRTTPRTQSALLESMQEATVSIDGRVIKLEQPFMVVATQNPFEFEGTYLLPENQLDRFLMRISLGYPTPEAEAQVLNQRPSESKLTELLPVTDQSDVLRLQALTDRVRIDDEIVQYIIHLANATREHRDLRIGLSPRGTLALAQAARATAVLDGRDYCIPEDVVKNIEPVCGHRVVSRNYLQTGDQSSGLETLREVMREVPAPA
ncbi:MAG: AAA family ATPase [Phycisphaerales bacterium JB050]